MDFCLYLSNALYSNIKLSVSICGFFLNLINIIVFFNIANSKQSSNANLFKYLLTKSICDFYILGFGVGFGVIDSYFKTQIQKYYAICIFRFIFDEYLCFVFQLISMFCEVASSFNRYRSIANRFQFLNKFSFKFKLILMVSYSVLFYVYKFFQKNCATYKTVNSTSLYYKLEHYSYFLHSPQDYALSIIHSVIRDGICSLIIIILNIFIFSFMRKVFTNKIEFNKNGSKNNNLQAKKIERSQKNLIYMVFTTSFFTLIGHLLMFIYYLPIQLLRFNNCLRSFSLLFFYLGFSISFFSYFCFNLHFKRFILRSLMSAVQFLTMNRFNLNTEKYENTKTVNHLTTHSFNNN
jgi:hypothetical protein